MERISVETADIRENCQHFYSNYIFYLNFQLAFH
jgi:hypothetical protein